MDVNPYEAPIEQGHHPPAAPPKSTFSPLRVFAFVSCIVALGLLLGIVGGVTAHMLQSKSPPNVVRQMPLQP
jgi:hypothetical protein